MFTEHYLILYNWEGHGNRKIINMIEIEYCHEIYLPGI